jgi:hypothetical protein
VATSQAWSRSADHSMSSACAGVAAANMNAMNRAQLRADIRIPYDLETTAHRSLGTDIGQQDTRVHQKVDECRCARVPARRHGRGTFPILLATADCRKILAASLTYEGDPADLAQAAKRIEAGDSLVGSDPDHLTAAFVAAAEPAILSGLSRESAAGVKAATATGEASSGQLPSVICHPHHGMSTT